MKGIESRCLPGQATPVYGQDTDFKEIIPL